MNIVVVPNSAFPFRWKGKNYKITKCGILDGMSYAETDPKEPELEETLKRKLETDKGLRVYWASGYVCFIEDHHDSIDI